MLRVESLRAEEYLKWVAMGPSDVSTKSASIIRLLDGCWCMRTRRAKWKAKGD
jgi:hypothetical protein